MELTNRAIAEAVGWKITPVENHVEVQWYRLINPLGETHTRNTAYGMQDLWPEYDVDDEIPDYLHDANAALALWDDEPCWIETGRPVNDMGFFCLVRGHSPRDLTNFYTTATLRAEAIARCWWAYKHKDGE